MYELPAVYTHSLASASPASRTRAVAQRRMITERCLSLVSGKSSPCGGATTSVSKGRPRASSLCIFIRPNQHVDSLASRPAALRSPPRAFEDQKVQYATGCPEAVMNSIGNGLGMRETEITREPSRPWSPHFYAIFAQVHNTL
jgi:hypothetical protein